MFRVATSQLSSDASAMQFVAMWLRIVTSIALNAMRPATGSAALTADRRNRFQQRQQLSYVVRVGSGERGGQRNAPRIRNDVMFSPRLAPIRGVGADFCPPSTARTLELSTTTRDQSILSAPF